MRTLRPKLNFSFVENQKDYAEVLALRHREYAEAGKLALGASVASMGDEFDAHSKIIIGKKNGQVVTTLRVIYHHEGQRMEQEKFISWPDHLPRPCDIVEVTRACVHSDLRGTDAFLSMLIFFGENIVREGIPWVVISASEEMLSFYQKSGQQKVGLSYAHAGLNGKIHHVLMANVNALLTGKKVHPLFWNASWGEVYRRCDEEARRRLSKAAILRAELYSLLNPAAKWMLERKLRQKALRRASFALSPSLKGI